MLYKHCHCSPSSARQPQRRAMAVTLEEPEKSPLDKKLYRRVKLGNGLDVLLIHDPEMEGAEEQHAVCQAAEHEECDDGCEHAGGEEVCRIWSFAYLLY